LAEGAGPRGGDSFRKGNLKKKKGRLSIKSKGHLRNEQKAAHRKPGILWRSRKGSKWKNRQAGSVSAR